MAKLKAKIFDLQGKVEGTIRLPKIFQTPVRTDVIKRAVLAIQSHRFSLKEEILWPEKEQPQNHAE